MELVWQQYCTQVLRLRNIGISMHRKQEGTMRNITEGDYSKLCYCELLKGH